MMGLGSGVRQVPRFLLCGFGSFRRAVLEAEAVVSGFEDVTTVGETIGESGRLCFGVQFWPPIGVGPWERTEADLTFDRQAGLSKDESSWPGIDLTASSLSVRSRKSFWLAIRSTVWRNATTSRAI